MTSNMSVIVVGAGIIGSAIAWNLAKSGASVRVIDAGPGPASGATGASFGWINASFFHDAAHFELRHAGIRAWRAAQTALPDLPVSWTGALWWEDQGAALDKVQSDLQMMGYDVARVTSDELQKKEPAVATLPEEALFFSMEGIADPARAARMFLSGALAQGAKCLFGLNVQAVEPRAVTTDAGRFTADHIILAGGTGTEALMQAAGHPLPMLRRPGLLLRTAPQPFRLAHILVTPEGEIRQDSAGRIVMPAAVSHQMDASEDVESSADAVADEAIGRLHRMLAQSERLDWQDVQLGWRPVPQDGLPVIGSAAPGLYVAVMHSGVTLAALAGELVCAEVLGTLGNRAGLLEPYRPARFAPYSISSFH